MTATRRAACVCVFDGERYGAVSGERIEPQEGGAIPRLGPAIRTGRCARYTTTTGTLVEYSSSIGRKGSTSGTCSTRCLA
jgi:hypothetical protein